MFIFLTLYSYFRYSTDGYTNVTEVVLITDELNHRSVSDSKLSIATTLPNTELSLSNN
jgi:hypothetical protein